MKRKTRAILKLLDDKSRLSGQETVDPLRSRQELLDLLSRKRVSTKARWLNILSVSLLISCILMASIEFGISTERSNTHKYDLGKIKDASFVEVTMILATEFSEDLYIVQETPALSSYFIPINISSPSTSSAIVSALTQQTVALDAQLKILIDLSQSYSNFKSKLLNSKEGGIIHGEDNDLVYSVSDLLKILK